MPGFLANHKRWSRRLPRAYPAPPYRAAPQHRLRHLRPRPPIVPSPLGPGDFRRKPAAMRPVTRQIGRRDQKPLARQRDGDLAQHLLRSGKSVGFCDRRSRFCTRQAIKRGRPFADANSRAGTQLQIQQSADADTCAVQARPLAGKSTSQRQPQTTTRVNSTVIQKV